MPQLISRLPRLTPVGSCQQSQTDRNEHETQPDSTDDGAAVAVLQHPEERPSPAEQQHRAYHAQSAAAQGRDREQHTTDQRTRRRSHRDVGQPVGQPTIGAQPNAVAASSPSESTRRKAVRSTPAKHNRAVSDITTAAPPSWASTGDRSATIFASAQKAITPTMQAAASTE